MVFQKVTQSSESDTDFIQDITINSVFEASICGENETPTKAKRDLNKIYIQNLKNMILTKK